MQPGGGCPVVDECSILKDNGPAKDTGTNIQQFSSAIGHSLGLEWIQWSSDCEQHGIINHNSVSAARQGRYTWLNT